MLVRPARPWTPALFPVVLLLAVLTLGCDSSTDPVIDEVFIGDWSVESFVIDGVEQVVAGGGFNLAIGLPGCNASGDYDYTGSTLIFDPGTADEVRVQYSVAGNEMTVTGSADGTPFTGLLRKR
ncbi:MAG: hypothetical protein P8188_14570 [Gemmatimonadota bacterium]